MHSPSPVNSIPFPARIFMKAMTSSSVPTITNIINTSLTTGIVLGDLKIAIVRPLLKKPSLNKNLLKNYRPISHISVQNSFFFKSFSTNFSPISKKTTSATQLTKIAYRAEHSTRTVLVRAVNDILSALNKDISVLLLDLSAAFDTIHHQILLSRLNSVFGIQPTALQWF